MGSRKIYIPLCGTVPGSCYAEPSGQNCGKGASVSEEKKLITLAIRDPEMEIERNRVIVRLPNSADYEPFNCDVLEECISIARDPETFHPISGAVTSLEPYPHIDVYRPYHCQWFRTVVTGHKGLDDTSGELFAETYKSGSRNGVPRTEVDKNERTDCKSYKIPPQEYDVLDNGIMVPGMEARAHLFFTDGKREKEVVCGKKYYRTCSITGGVVKEVRGDYDSTTIYYIVEVEGVLYACRASDHVDYEVGDWVFLMSAQDSCDLNCDLGQVEYSGEDDSALRSQTRILLNLINALREEHGVGRLSINTNLASAAQNHCKDMVSNSFIGHTGSDGSSSQERITATGYGMNAQEMGTGENLAKGFNDAESVFGGWLASPRHFANMIRPEFKETGFSVIRAKDGTVHWANTFGFTADAPEGSALDPAKSNYVIIPMKIGWEGA